jgi:aquaporin Z
MKKYIAEFVGTFALVFFGAGSIIINQLSEGLILHAGISVIFGLVVLIMILAFGSISGAHINPAVSFGFFIEGQLDKKNLLNYIIAQLLGAVFASCTLFLLFEQQGQYGMTTPSGSALQSFILELILSYFLMLVILLVSQNKQTAPFTAIAVGATVAMEAWFAGPISGASMNPARSFGPALIAFDFDELWIYFLAPVLGAFLAAHSYKYLHK